MGCYGYEDYLIVFGVPNKLYRRVGYGFGLIGEYDLGIQHCKYVNRKLFYSGRRDLYGVNAYNVWDIDIDPVNPTYSGFYYSTRSYYWGEFDVSWPYMYVAGAAHGVEITRYDPATGIFDDPLELPIEKSLLSSYPNPFNHNAMIRYVLLEPGDVNLSVYNLLGQQVSTLVIGAREAGEHSVSWDTSDFPSGVYFARLSAADHSESIKMVLLK